MNIAIIGGTGGMGKLFGRFFKEQGFKVALLGRKTKDIRQKLSLADIIFISIPSSAIEYAVDLLQLIDLKGKIVISLGSLMTPDLQKMAKIKGEIACMHALFGPAVYPIVGQNVVISGNVRQKHLKTLISRLKRAKVRVSIMSAKEHDTYMAYIQALSQFSSISLGHTLSKSGLKHRDLKNLSTFTFRMNEATIQRILSQEAELWALIQFENPHFLKVLDNHIKNMLQLRAIIEKKEFKKFKALYTKIATFWTK